MSPRTIIWIVFILVFVVGRALRKALAGGVERRRAEAGDAGYEATTADIQEFLRGLTSAAGQGTVGVQQGPADGMQVLEGPARAEAARPAAPVGRAAATPFWEGRPAVPIAVPGPAAKPLPVRTQRRRQPAQQPKRRPREPLAAAGRPTVVPPKAAAGGPPLSLALRGTDLRRAVVWAEILGPPVSRRRARRLPPGSPQ